MGRRWGLVLGCLLGLVGSGGALSAAPEDGAASGPAARAQAAIRWFLPARFDEALAAARAQKRILVIKGVSFGIDEAGARCATAGLW